ncbi:A/G-specific adenine glycosylase [Neiella marina]|uniref:Adenine DNA glycosylase n=1 Tax=Neiella holothuriorum TaxID=2870530 RepID=A0ABS7EJV3_9GAMM|nr:A/G-specific adenine glycosylase [Neiella holothuriorum]MBW8192643.1 A/G-specific adenine glycosylase [Neiella holothuriorum]
MSATDILGFQHRLLSWAETQGRHDLPWQLNPTPYSVLVSEIMLQQTQVATVIPYFERWMTSFPTIDALAAAEEDHIMAHWQGLGYYSRARNLHKAARYVVEQCDGEFPSDLKGLECIPGVGRYTAGAVMSFAFDRYGPIVDGNVKRLFCRLFAIEGQLASSTVSKRLWSLAEQLTPATDQPLSNRRFAQSLLDMGATLCKPKSPDCTICPLANQCQALASNRVSELPTPKPKKTLPVKTAIFDWHLVDQEIFLVKRPADGIWGGLWCLPEYQQPLDQVAETKAIGRFRHTFSHYKLAAEVINMAQHRSEHQSGKWFALDTLATIGLPKPIKSFIEKHTAKAAD